MMPPRHVAQRGFTLLELIVAMTLAALIVALGANILRMGMDFYHRSHAYIHQQQEVRGFLKLLRDELRGGGQGAQVLAGEPTRMEFVTDNIPVGIGRSGQNNISLECRGNEQGKFDLIHRIRLRKAIEEKGKKLDEIAKPGTAKAEPAKVEVERVDAIQMGGALPEYEDEILVQQLSWCSFSFLLRNIKEGKATAVWVGEWHGEIGLPLAIRVQLASLAGNLPPVVIPLSWP